MIDSQAVLYSEGNNDECMTPKYAVIPILKYIPRNSVVWCPFDTENSEYVIEISKQNKVIFSHLAAGQDFYKYKPSEHWDILISNPPFTNKRGIFERALSFGKPMALLMSNTWLNDKYSKWVFYQAQRQMQLLMFDQRIKFKTINPETGEFEVQKKITFSSSYFCSDFLPKDIVIERLEVF